MTLHRMDLPDAPVRVHESRLTPGTWLWRCLDAPLHHSRGYATWDEAWDAMEHHRLSEHHPAREAAGAINELGYRMPAGMVIAGMGNVVRLAAESRGGTVTYNPRSKP